MKEVVLTGVGFFVGVGEALIYYNMGQSESSKFRFRIPPTPELLKTAGMVLLTSIITTALFKGIELAISDSPEEKKNVA